MSANLMDGVLLRETFAAFPSGVTAVSAVVDGRPVGMAASSFTSVSLEPPLVSVCVAETSTTWPVLRGVSHLGVSVLAADQEAAARRLATRGVDRFADLAWRSTTSGAVFVGGASAWLECSVDAEHPAGDHHIVVLRVHDLGADHHIHPLVFHASRYRRLEP